MAMSVFLLALPLALVAQAPEAVQTPGGSIMERRCLKEVVELHEFIEDWFNAKLPPTEESFWRFDSVIAADFVLISPSGELAERDELVDRLRSAHGIWLQTRGPGRIWIENLQFRHQVGDQAMVIYEEWQETEGEVRGRLSSAVFKRLEGTPNGVEWIHLHEVWLPE